MSAIKLYEIRPSDGVRRLQSQLYLGRTSADFIIRNGMLFTWSEMPYGGFEWMRYDEPYEIVTDINDMKTQPL